MLAGQEDLAAEITEQVAVVSNVPTKEETEESNALIWVAVLWYWERLCRWPLGGCSLAEPRHHGQTPSSMAWD